MDKLIEIDVSGNIKIREATKAGFALAEAGDSGNTIVKIMISEDRKE